MRCRLGISFACLAGLVCFAVLGGMGVPSRQAVAAPASGFVFSGGGFGHGVGMSQYGAYGQAAEGRTAAQILQHYYTDTTVEAVPDAVPLRVNLLHAQPSAHARGQAVGPGGGTILVRAGSVTFPGLPHEVFDFSVGGTDRDHVVVSKGETVLAQAPEVSVEWPGGPTVLNFIGPSETFARAKHQYRYGKADLAVVDGALEVVNQLSLRSEYLRGLGEMPSSWPAQALQAQVIAARSYALRKYHLGVRPDCRCHLFDTSVHQVFVGWTKESGPSGAAWVTAIAATQPTPTTGLAVVRRGVIIPAHYFSSSAGRTESNEDGFGGSSPLPYLRSVDDHWSLAQYNPHASWSRTVSQVELASVFGLPDVVSIDVSDRTAGGAVHTVTASSSNGATSSITGSEFRSKLALPSRWIHPTVEAAPGE